jgi:hypothetical protein
MKSQSKKPSQLSVPTTLFTAKHSLRKNCPQRYEKTSTQFAIKVVTYVENNNNLKIVNSIKGK